jgi:hypothetical protein
MFNVIYIPNCGLKRYLSGIKGYKNTEIKLYVDIKFAVICERR